MKMFGFEFRSPFGRAEQPVPVTVAETINRPMRIARARRSFDAGLISNLTSSWTTSDSTINMSLLKDLRVMRARSRDFFRNMELGRKFGAMVVNNVVGPSGFALKVDCCLPDGRPDAADSLRVSQAYWRWQERGQFDVTGKLSEAEFDRLMVRMVARDGEALIRLVEGSDRGIHGCQLQLLPGHLLDEEHNRDLADGRKIRMGVEFDGFMKPVAYHLRVVDGTADMYGSGSKRYQRVPAAEIIHVFIAEDAEQWRGMPWAYAALRRARDADKFEEAALIAANIGASSMGFYQQKDPEAGPPMAVDGSENGDDDQREPEEFTTEIAPGEFRVIPSGYEFSKFDPNYPSDVFEPFQRSVTRMIATGLLVSYHGLTGDLTQVSFSSIRAGTLDDREVWKVLQDGFIACVKKPVFSWWLARAMVYDSALKTLPFAKFDKFNAPIYSGRRWDWVDPKSEIVAAKEAVGLGIASRQQLCRDRGLDFDVIRQELEQEAEMGFAPPKTSGAVAANTPVQSDDQE